jgi:small subunit ribosomal protein S16
VKLTILLGAEGKEKMAVKVRLSRAGGRHRPFYRVVVADERAPRDGHFLELVGTYNPKTEPAQISLNRERIDYWLSKGAKASQTVSELLHRDAKSN